jgi:hypothetical protein
MAMSHGYHAAAFRAFPFPFLAGQKLFHPLSFDELQVVNHAHLIAPFVLCIQFLQPLAWERVALKTKAGLIRLYNLAVVKKASSLFPLIQIAAGAFFIFPQIRFADPTVHPAWRNQSCFHPHLL